MNYVSIQMKKIQRKSESKENETSQAEKLGNLRTYIYFFKKLLFYTVKSVIMSSFCHLYLHTVISFSVIVICFLENKEVTYYTVDV